MPSNASNMVFKIFKILTKNSGAYGRATCCGHSIQPDFSKTLISWPHWSLLHDIKNFNNWSKHYVQATEMGLLGKGESIPAPQKEEVSVADSGDPLLPRWWESISRHSFASSTLLIGRTSVHHFRVQRRHYSFSPAVEGGRWMRITGTFPGPFASLCPRSPFLEGSVRFKHKSNKKIKKAKAKRREELHKINKIFVRAKKRIDLLTPEERLEHRIEKETKKVELIKEALDKLPKQEIPPGNPDHNDLNAELVHYYMRMGYKNANYVPVGRRGIHGGTIQNIHLHWKKHETVQVEIVGFSEEEIKIMAVHLERLSGGKLIHIHPQKNIVILWRGINYKQPKVLVPGKTLDKRKALEKSKLDQSLRTHQENVVKLERELISLWKQNAPRRAHLFWEGARVCGIGNSIDCKRLSLLAGGEEPLENSEGSGDPESKCTVNHQGLRYAVSDIISPELSSDQETPAMW